MSAYLHVVVVFLERLKQLFSKSVQTDESLDLKVRLTICTIPDLPAAQDGLCSHQVSLPVNGGIDANKKRPADSAAIDSRNAHYFGAKALLDCLRQWLFFQRLLQGAVSVGIAELFLDVDAIARRIRLFTPVRRLLFERVEWRIQRQP